MKFRDLENKIKTPIFYNYELLKHFAEPKSFINIQLSRFCKSGNLVSLKRGFYAFTDRKIDEFVLANKLYSPSYVSLESALNAYGVIPDITANVTSVTPTTSKKIKTSKGQFLYSKMSKALYFGFKSQIDLQSGLYYQIALPEKALLDYIYLRNVKDLAEARVNLKMLNKKLLLKFSIHFPNWVRKVVAYE